MESKVLLNSEMVVFVYKTPRDKYQLTDEHRIIMVSKKVLSVVLRFFNHIPTYILSKKYWKNAGYVLTRHVATRQKASSSKTRDGKKKKKDGSPRGQYVTFFSRFGDAYCLAIRISKSA